MKIHSTNVRLRSISILALLGLIVGQGLFAADALKAHGIFRSNMVLQRDKPITIWGWAAARAEVEVLVGTRAMADFFESTARACNSARSAANWIARDLRKEVNERGVEISEVSISPEALAGLIRLVEEGRLTTKNAKELLPELVDQGGDPEALMLERGLEAVSDAGLIEALVDEVMAAQGEAVELVRAGDDKPLNFLMGKVMKASQGKANPAEVRGRLIEKIRGASVGQIDS